MRYTEDDLREKAEDLPGEVGLSDDPRSRLLCVMEILNTFTNEEEGLTVSEIAQILANRSNSKKPPSEPTILKDIHAIANNKPNGVELDIPTRGKSGGTRCVRRLISSEQARLLISIVKTCKFISQRQCDELESALNSHVSYRQQDQILENFYIDKAEREEGNSVFAAISVASECMREKNNIAFRYSYRGFDGKRQYLSDDKGNELFEEIPLELVYSFGYYYLGTLGKNIDGEDEIKMRRLDRMHNVRRADAIQIDAKKIANLKKEIKERVRHQIDMMGDGLVRTLFLKVKEGAANIIYNRYGKSCKFEHISQGGKEAYIRLKVQLSPTFYRWIFGMGDKVEIVKPRDWIWATDKSWRDGSPSMEQLENDYEAAISGFVKMLDEVRTLY